MALVLVLILVLGISATAALLLNIFLSDKKMTDSVVYRMHAASAAEAGVEIAVRMLWGDYLAQNGDESGNLSEYQAFLTDLGIGEDAPHELLNAPRQLPNGALVSSIQTAYQTDSDGLLVTVTARGAFQQVERTATQTFRLAGGVFKGFGFALLANNVNCIMCHADFDNVYRVNNTDPSLYGTFDRVKIASLESLMLRTGSADSSIAGSYYTRGSIMDNKGNALSTLAGTSMTTVDFHTTGETAGKLIQDASGGLTETAFSLAETDDEGAYLPYGSLYTDYPTDSALMTDGELPASFPPVIPDENGNKRVDQDEFDGVIDTFSQGSITGGIAFGVPEGSTFEGTTLPSSSNEALDDLGADGQYAGNVVLVGTPENPIQIDGKIAVDGDLIIKGPISGTGQIFAKRNIYFVGDTTYADAAGKYGQGADESQNLVAYAAGGNILIGDYLTPKNISDVNSAVSLSESGIDPGGPPNSGLTASFTMSEVTLFNRMEYVKQQADPSYVPRYYQLREGDPIYRFEGTSEHGDKYNEKFVAFTPPANAAVVSLDPQSNWVSELLLKNLWSQDELSRPASGAPFRIDGLVYTNNAIFALARSSKHKSRTKGQILVRGGMVAADVGILSPGDSGGRGFTMHYDERVKDFLGITTSEEVEFVRLYLMLD